MAANIRCIMRAKAPYGQGITKMKVKLTPEQSSTPSLMPETNSVYLTRPTEGTGELMELVGGSVAWNQLVQNGDFASTSGWTYEDGTIAVADNILSYTVTTKGQYSYSNQITQALSNSIPANHKFILSAWVKPVHDQTMAFWFLGSPPNSNNNYPVDLVGGQWNHVEIIGNTNAVKTHVQLGLSQNLVSGDVVGDVIQVKNVYLTNLTQMLGSTIADYVYSLEQSTAGSGIAWLKSCGFFTEDYYAYSAPTLQSVEATSHVTKDANNTTIATYPLDSDLVLRGIPKLSNGNLYYNGDTYEWDGTVNRRFAEVDLGSLSWNKVNTSTGHWRFGVSIASMKGTGGNSTKFKCVCTKYLGITPNESYTGVTGITANGADGALFVCDESYSDAAAFKTAMSGVMLVYEMVSVTTESADPFTAVQTVEDGGTEKFVTTNNVPVGVVGRFANAVPMEGVDSFSVTANDGTSHTYPVTLSEEIYRGYVDMLTGEAVSDMASIAEYNGETISEPWLSSLDVYALGATPTKGAQVVYPITPEEVTATITGDPSELSGVVSATSTEGTVDWSELSEIGIKCIMKRKNPFQ